MPTRSTPLKLLPKIAERAEKRVQQLNQTHAGYVGILLWNYAQAPTPIDAERDAPDMVRVNFGMYWRGNLQALLVKMAKDAGLSTNALAEALIARDLRSPDAHLAILPARGSVKARLPT